MTLESFLFYFLGAISVGSALMMVTRRNPVIAALYLILNFFALGGLYLSLHAQFIAFIQILVYAGAIMVLFLFVIMLLNLGKEQKRVHRHRLQKILGVLLGAVLLFQIGMVFRSALIEGTPGNFTAEKVAAVGNTQVVARLLFTDFLLPFEITSVLLLVAIVGAVILAKREI